MATQHEHFDVIIVGGGVIGCSIAYRLAGYGRRVLLLEARRELGDAASSRNGGITGAGSSLHAKYGRKVYDVTSANWALMQTLSEELDADFEFVTSGTLDVATAPEHLAHLERTVTIQRAAGLDVHLLDRDAARELMPAFSEHILGAELAVERGRLTPR
ncbi:MAG: FAD-binding oxidoreductase, partial [Chloroflexia bacterium]|nr:FAD-binding oxidoreductase [Chloroflexia bacterium]